MQIFVNETAKTLGIHAAEAAAAIINEAIKEKGEARIVLSTGASQLTTLEPLITMDVDWSKVVMFHLDEYVDLPETHVASFRKYLKERFIQKIPLKAAYLVDGTAEGIAALTKELRAAPIDLGLIGIGENAHIAFNDPPADFDTDAAYIVVTLDTACRNQQVAEGWYPNIDAVPKQAISMTCRQIMACEKIISVVPYIEKADAIAATLANPVTNLVPATLMKTHADLSLYCDAESVSKADLANIVMPEGKTCTIER